MARIGIDAKLQEWCVPGKKTVKIEPVKEGKQLQK